MNPELIDILCCPETKQPVKPADKELVSKFNKLVSQRKLKNRGGKYVRRNLDSALIREDGKYAYPIRNNIPIMLIDEAIEVKG